LTISAHAPDLVRAREEGGLVMPMMYGNGYGWEGVLIIALNMLFWVALIAAAIWAFTRWQAGRTSSSDTAGPSAAEILRRRYARGEIDTATYEEMRRRLELADELGDEARTPARS
jgi:putative membrane protein